MKNTLHRLLSALLLICMLAGVSTSFMTFVSYSDDPDVTYNQRAEAEGDSEEEEDPFTAEDLNTEVYNSAAEKLATMKLYITYDEYELYGLDVTGEIAVKNTTTGQVLFSNPWDANQTVKAQDTLNTLFSQLSIDYSDNTGVLNKPMNSFVEAAMRGQIAIEYIKNGISVEYTVGRADDRHLVPRCIERSRFETVLLAYIEDTNILKKLNAMYVLYDPFDETKLNAVKKSWLENYPIIGSYDEKKDVFTPNMAVYVAGSTMSNYELNKVEEWIRTWCPHYTYDELEYDHELTKYTANKTVLPVFKLALEYTLSQEGLTVRLPANSISFNEDYFRLNSVTVLPYFGAGSSDYNGYTMVPDGSGSIIRFEDIKGVSYNYTSQLYGPDYAYHTLKTSYTGKAQIVRYPVFGVVEDYVEQIHYNPDGSVACGHIYVPTVTAPTCTERGYTTYTCKHCEKTYVSDYTDAAHKWNNGVVQKEATETETGEMLYTCTVCGATKTEVIPKKGTVTPPPTDPTDPTDPTEPEETLPVIVWDEDTYVISTKRPRGYCAIVTAGESLCDITSSHAGTLHKYNSVYVTVNPRPSDSYNLADSISVGSDSSWTVVSKRKYTGSYSIKYVMLSEEDGCDYEPTYSGMAAAYRDYLINNGTLTKNEVKSDIPLYIETLGCFDTTTTVMSIPVVVTSPLATFDDLSNMVGNLSNSGISNINFKLTGYTNGGYYCSIPYHVSFENKVGGDRGYSEFVEFAKEKGIGVFPEFDFAYSHGSRLFDGFNSFTDAVKTIDDRFIVSKRYDANMQIFRNTGELAISASVFDKYYENFGPAFKDLGSIGISVSTLGTDLNSDFDEDEPYNREDSKNQTTSLLAAINADYGKNVMVDGGNAYSYKYAGHILNIALRGSEYLKTSASVPFIQMVLHGYINYAGTPTNMASNLDMEVLDIIECGASPYFFLCVQNMTEMKDDRELSKYYSVSYDTWSDDIIRIYKELNDALNDVQDADFIEHNYILGERILDADEIDEAFESEKAGLLKAWKNYVITVKKYERAQELYTRLLAEGRTTANSGSYYEYMQTEKISASGNKIILEAALGQYSYMIKDYVKSEDGFVTTDAYDYSLITATEEEVKAAFESAFTFDKLAIGSYDEEGNFVPGRESFKDPNGKYITSNYTVDSASVSMSEYDNGIVFVVNKNSFGVVPAVDGEAIIVKTADGESILQVGAYGYAKLKKGSDGSFTLVTEREGV